MGLEVPQVCPGRCVVTSGEEGFGGAPSQEIRASGKQGVVATWWPPGAVWCSDPTLSLPSSVSGAAAGNDVFLSNCVIEWKPNH